MGNFIKIVFISLLLFFVSIYGIMINTENLEMSESTSSAQKSSDSSTSSSNKIKKMGSSFLDSHLNLTKGSHVAFHLENIQ